MTRHKGTTESKRQAKRVLLRTRGQLPLPCDNCGELVTRGHVHHRDHNPFNNVPENLAWLHRKCHQQYHAASEITRARRSKASIARNAVANLQTPEVFAKRSVTMKARFTDPAVRAATSEAVREALKDPAKAKRRRAGVQASWDGNEARREHMSGKTKDAYTTGKLQKSPCPYGCALTTYPAPLARHVKAKHLNDKIGR